MFKQPLTDSKRETLFGDQIRWSGQTDQRAKEKSLKLPELMRKVKINPNSFLLLTLESLETKAKHMVDKMLFYLSVLSSYIYL